MGGEVEMRALNGSGMSFEIAWGLHEGMLIG